MRPLKLTMTAFGPYKDTETIDFTALKDLQLFVISGATGAGKTTMFDAICFSLYGSASGEDRENVAMLRSHFADDDIHTKVEFTFEINTRIYRVIRQIGHVKKGNKTKTGDKFELYEKVGTKELSIVDRQMVTEVNQKIEQLIGLTEDQFKQIVMLPQGEFRKLLTSETENKEEILRRLFNTVKFTKMNEHLKQKRDKLQSTYEQEKIQLDHIVQSIPQSLHAFEDSAVFETFEQTHYSPEQVMDSLSEDLQYLNKKITEDEYAYHEKFKAHDKMLTTYYEGAEINKRFAELAEKRINFNKMKDEKPSIKIKERQWEQANKAEQIRPYETQLKAIKKEQHEKAVLLESQQKVLNQAKANYEQREAQYKKEDKREPVRDQLKVDLEKYKSYLPVVRESAQKKEKLHKQKFFLKEAADNIQKDKQQHTSYKNTIEDLQTSISKNEREADRLPTLHLELDHLRKHFKLITAYQKLLYKRKEAQIQADNAEEIFKQKDRTYKHYEQQWLNAQAVVLASHLRENEACPVCGSDHHPQLAVGAEDGVTKETLEIKLRERKDSKATYETQANEFKVILAQIADKLTEIKEESLEVGEQNLQEVLDELERKGQVVSKAHKVSETSQQELQKDKKSLEKIKQSEDRLKKEIEAKEVDYREKWTDHTALDAAYQAQLETIPESMRIMAALEAAIKETESTLHTHEENWKTARERLEKAKEEKQHVENSISHQQTQLTELETKKEMAQKVFDQRLDKAGFQEISLYEAAKRTEEERQQLEDTVRQFKQHYYSLQEQITEGEAALSGAQQVDVTKLKEDLDILKNQYEKALEAWNTSKQQKEKAAQFILQMEQLIASVAEKERETGTITYLYDVLRGQNDLKISFERYLQIDYLDNIIEAANQRFQELMNGQFYLIRSERQASHGRQSGLAIDVFDSYTGQTRDVKTLSGGEKFIASLCLALGMSDVIQSFRGSISIDTMFIDEGFGSLDEESLQKAIQALIQLQESGRLIGVISHVEELKNIFPAILHVTKTRDGHSKAFFQIK